VAKILTEAYLTDLINRVVLAHQKETLEAIFRMRDSLENVHKALQGSVADWRKIAAHVERLQARMDHFDAQVKASNEGYTQEYVKLRHRLEDSLAGLRRQLKDAQLLVDRNREKVDRVLAHMAEWENKHGK